MKNYNTYVSEAAYDPFNTTDDDRLCAGLVFRVSGKMLDVDAAEERASLPFFSRRARDRKAAKAASKGVKK